MGIKLNIGLAVKLFLFTLFSILLRGYQYGSGNQVHYFNFAFHKFYPNLFQTDYLFKIHDIPFTIFVDFIHRLLNTFSENILVFFLIYFAFLLVFYSSIYAISNFLFKNTKIAWLTLFLFIFPIPIGGSTIHTVEKSLTPRFVAETFLLVSTYFLLIKKRVISSALSGIGFLFHPITIIPYLPIVVLSSYFEDSKNLKNFLKNTLISTSVFLLVSFPILIKFVFQGQGGGLFVDPEWLTIIRGRLSYLFIEDWSLINFVVITVICLFFTFYRFVFKEKLNPTVKAVGFVSLTIFIFALLSSLTGFRLGLQLQLGRNLYLFVVMFLIFGSGSALSLLSETNLKRIAILFVIAPIILCFPGRSEFGILWMNPIENYQQVALWAKENTPEQSVFLVPLDEFGFRFWSKRSVFIEHKEGGDSLYDRNFAMEWNKRRELIEDKELTGDLLAQLKNEYGVNYAITKEEVGGLKEVYRYKNYFVYEI